MRCALARTSFLAALNTVGAAGGHVHTVVTDVLHDAGTADLTHINILAELYMQVGWLPAWSDRAACASCAPATAVSSYYL